MQWDRWLSAGRKRISIEALTAGDSGHVRVTAKAAVGWKVGWKHFTTASAENWNDHLSMFWIRVQCSCLSRVSWRQAILCPLCQCDECDRCLQQGWTCQTQDIRYQRNRFHIHRLAQKIHFHKITFYSRGFLQYFVKQLWNNISISFDLIKTPHYCSYLLTLIK